MVWLFCVLVWFDDGDLVVCVLLLVFREVCVWILAIIGSFMLMLGGCGGCCDCGSWEFVVWLHRWRWGLFFVLLLMEVSSIDDC